MLMFPELSSLNKMNLEWTHKKRKSRKIAHGKFVYLDIKIDSGSDLQKVEKVLPAKIYKKTHGNQFLSDLLMLCLLHFSY